MNYDVEGWYGGAMLDPDRRPDAVKTAMQELQDRVDDFDCIAVRGFSGATMGSILAWELGKGLIIVRKEGESSHGSPVEGALDNTPAARYLIVDDFVSSGDTIAAIVNAIGQRARCIGYYMWTNSLFVSAAEMAKMPKLIERIPELSLLDSAPAAVTADTLLDKALANVKPAGRESVEKALETLNDFDFLGRWLNEPNSLLEYLKS